MPKKGRKSGKRNTGAPAPRKELETGPSPIETNRTTRKRKANGTPVIAAASDEDDHELEPVTFQEHYAKTPAGTKWCRGCNDETDLPKLLCDCCNQVICSGKRGSGACIELDTDFLINPTWASFICPGCEWDKARKGSSGGQFTYYGFYDQNKAPLTSVIVQIRNRDYAFFKPMKLERLAIVQLEVDGLTSDFTLPFDTAALWASIYSSGKVGVEDVLEHRLSSPNVTSLEPSPQPLLTQRIVFDFNTIKGSDRYTEEIVALRNAIQRMGINRIVFFIVTHTDPGSGDLHYTANGGGAHSLQTVIGRLFPVPFQHWLKEKETYMFLLVCGSKLLTLEGYNYMTDLATNRIFNHMFFFPAAYLQPAETSFFIANFVKYGLYQDEPINQAVSLSLEGQRNLGCHTRIIRVSSCDGDDKLTFHAVRYVWSQKSRRPFGLEAPTHCTKCNGIKTFSAKSVLTGDGVVEVIMSCLSGLCSAELRVSLTEMEKNLEQGSKHCWGSWQHHNFVWDAALMQRV
ncbi:hypothetical protein VKT23_019937 [Stygiomarasmius scandens]|uniref:Uncharacterized protein n=1 Tax=Marasmiellus scandens TaxID=2682957 RepID=A0ABR1INA7_9AGAR